MYRKILDPKRQEVLPHLGFLKQYNCYLAGGTALALHIGHRTSMDFDFYTDTPFPGEKVLQHFVKEFPKKIEAQLTDEDTLRLLVNGVELTLFLYPYELIEPWKEWETLRIASIPDIAAMKIIAVTQRAKQRDFVDLYYLIKQFGLSRILTWTKQKYPHFEPMLGLKGMTFFEDIEDDTDLRKIILFDRSITWSKVQQYLVQQANAVAKK